MVSEPGEGLVGVYKGEGLRVITEGARGGTRMSGRRASGKKVVEKPRTDLQEIALYPVENLCLYTSRSDTCQTEESQD